MTAIKEAQAVADVEQGLILATVEIAAPPGRVFEALVRSEDVLRWWGSEDTYRTTEWEADVRPGGKWRAAGEGRDGNKFTVEGEYTAVEPPYKLAFTWRPVWDAPHETRVTDRLEPSDAGTKLTVRHDGFGSRTVVCRNPTDGWNRVLGWLHAYLVNG